MTRSHTNFNATKKIFKLYIKNNIYLMTFNLKLIILYIHAIVYTVRIEHTVLLFHLNKFMIANIDYIFVPIFRMQFTFGSRD